MGDGTVLVSHCVERKVCTYTAEVRTALNLKINLIESEDQSY